MCLQKTKYSCGHTHLQQLPCDNNKKAGKERSCLSFKTKAPVPCPRRYDRVLNEPCLKCGRRLEGQQDRRELGSRGYVTPALYPSTPSDPQPMRGQRSDRDGYAGRGLDSFYETPPSARATRDLRPESYYEPGLNADVARLPGHYELPSSVWNTRGHRPDSYIEPGLNAGVASLPGHYELTPSVPARRPDSYHDPGLNAGVASLPGHYEAPTSARLTVSPQYQSPSMRPERTPSQWNRSRMPSSPEPTPSHQRRRPPPMPISVPPPYPSHYALGDGEVSPVSIGEADPHLVGPMSSTGDTGFQSMRSLRERYHNP